MTDLRADPGDRWAAGSPRKAGAPATAGAGKAGKAKAGQGKAGKAKAASGKSKGRRKGKATPARAAPRRSALGRLVRLGLVLAVWLVILGLAGLAYVAWDLPDVRQLAEPQRSPSIVVTTADGAVVSRIGAVYGRRLAYQDLDADLIGAVLATEDRRFFEHEGIDFRGIARAMVANLMAGHVVQGGSTITQQLAKNLFLSPERTAARKIKEALIAVWLEHHFTKHELLAIYLNRVYFGAGAYGADAAAQRYFGTGADNLTLAQGAMLAGLLKAPSRYAPTQDMDAARARTALVLDNMVANGFLTVGEAADAKANPAELNTAPTTGSGGRYFADWVLDDLGAYVGTTPQDLVVVTTLDAKLQAKAEEAVAAMLAAEGAEAGAQQAALIALAPDGAVLAMVGGRDYAASQFNRATQALRQPGSAFKLFVFLAALDAGMTPDSRFFDGPVSINGFAPKNYDGKYMGDVSLRQAVAHSLNTVAAQAAWKAGVDRVIARARSLGITTPLRRDLSIALGSSETTLIELTAAYGALANRGRVVLPYGIAEIRNNQGEVLYRRQGSGSGAVIPPGEVGQMTGMLEGVIAGGTGKAAAIPWPAAGKTGTSESYRDALFVGFTRDIVAGVWVGNDDNGAMKKVTGGGIPARLWASFMAGAMAGRQAAPLDIPPPDAATGGGEAGGGESGQGGGTFDDLIGGLLSDLGVATGGGDAGGTSGGGSASGSARSRSTGGTDK